MKPLDLSGKKFGKLTVIEKSGKNNNGCILWKCQCDCGNITILSGSRINLGKVKSCGCFTGESAKKRNSTHGMTKTRTYRIWQCMKSRCYYEKDQAYQHYHGRGITICDRWLNSFENFLEDMGKAPKGLTLDRINNDKGYSKENCRWATYEEQNKNRSGNKFLTFNDKTKCISDWAKEIGITKTSLGKRLKDGWSIEKSLTKKSRGIYLEYNGEIKSLKEWSKETGINYNTLKTRFFKKKSPEEILNTPHLLNVTYNGKTKSLKEWSKITGIKYHTLLQRYKNNWPVEKMLILLRE